MGLRQNREQRPDAAIQPSRAQIYVARLLRFEVEWRHPVATARGSVLNSLPQRLTYERQEA